MTSKADRNLLAREAKRKALDEAFNDAIDAISDEGVFSADQIYALQRMIQLLRAIYLNQ